ncbi:MAG: DoxX family membrane protein [Candidatus Rokubacteria bacterium]|nr:DoxX family membrane protein [Candidatus Rokubacteria bacterium]
MSRLELGLLIGRLFTGYWFLSAALIKIFGRNYLFSDALRGPLNVFLTGPAPEWYKAFLSGVVIPNLRLFAWLDVAGELGVGVGLLLGLWTRVSCLVALFLVLNYLSAKGFPNPQAGLDKVFVVLILILYLGHAGRVLGVDGWRANRAAGG